MKKLTAGIFATLLAVVSVGAAHAEIASKGYVDQQVDTVEATVANKADSATVTALAGRVDTAEGEIDTLQSEVDGKQDALGFTPENIENKTTTLSGTSTDTQYPSAKAVWDTIQTETTGIANEADVTALKGRVDTLETASANHVVKNEAITGGTHTKITYDAKGLVTAGANLTADDIPEIPNTKVSGLGSLATKSSVETADIASQAVTKEKLATDIVTSLGKADTALQKTTADEAYAVKTLETQVGTVSKENMGTTTATTVVAGVKEAIDAAKAADNKAGQAKTAADAAQGDVDALEAVVNDETTGLAAAHTSIDALESGKLDKDGTAARATADASGNEITKTYATKAEIAGMATDANLKLKQDKTDNSLATTNKTVVGAINEVKTQADKGVSDAAAAKSAADAAKDAADAAQATASAALPKATYNSEVGTVSATNMGTTASTVVTAIKEVKTQADKGVSDAATAKSAADAAQEAAETAQTTAEARIPKPSGECSNPTAKCVLVSNGTNSFEWEVIARDGEGA